MSMNVWNASFLDKEQKNKEALQKPMYKQGTFYGQNLYLPTIMMLL